MGQIPDGREDDSYTTSRFPGQMARFAETARAIEDSRIAAKVGKGEERISLFWRLFGGTLLSLTGLVCITAYQQFSSTLAELRAGISRLEESRANLVKTDEFNSRMTTMWSAIKELDTANASISALKERSTLLEQRLTAGEGERKDLCQELQRLRERLAALEGRQSATPAASASPVPAGLSALK